MYGEIGEEVVDDTVWIVKSHYPSSRTKFKCRDFTCSKVIICVQDPFELIVSKAHRDLTFTHSKYVENDFAEEGPEYFDQLIKNTVEEILDI